MTAGARGTSTGAIDGSGRLLQLIREGRTTTVSQLADALGVARSTVLQRLERLQAGGLVRSEVRVTGSRGRPAAVLEFRPGAAVVLAAHVGLSGTLAAAVDLDGRVLAHRLVDHDLGRGPSALLERVVTTFDELSADPALPTDRVVGIGVGIPGTFEFRSYARQHDLAAVDWDPAAFREALHERYRVPVVTDLDVNCLALSEHRASRPDAEVLVCVKLGSLIGSAVVVRGVPIRGANRLAGELGHVKVTDSRQECPCGSVGCLDAVAGGRALVRQLTEAGIEVQHVTQVVQSANAGVPEAVQVVRAAGRRIGEALASVVNLLNPSAISLWGYLVEAEPLLAGIRETLYRAALPASSEHLEVAPTPLGRFAGVRGAAMAVIDEVLDPDAVDRALLQGSWGQPAAV